MNYIDQMAIVNAVFLGFSSALKKQLFTIIENLLRVESIQKFQGKNFQSQILIEFMIK